MKQFALAIGILLTTVTTHALGTTWTVDDNGKADFSNIQAAIDAASNGDEILVYPGTYTNNGSFVVYFAGKSLIIRATGTPEETILDGQNARGVVIFAGGEDPSTLIDGFTITRGYSFSGAGISFSGISHPTISNCVITNNEAIDAGGGITCSGGNPTITGCTISNNSARTGGGGI